VEEEIKQLIIKYKKGLCNEQETELLNRWIDDQGTDKPDYLFQTEEHEVLLREEVRQGIKNKLFIEKKENNHWHLQQWLKIAAILLLVSTVGYWGWNKYGRRQTEHYITIYNPAGQLKTITLPDSSKVYLNADTKITFPNHFREKDRKITLVGEAYFEVVHNAEKPFLIYTGRLRTQVLGTSFNVKAYANEPKITVAVTTGKVGVVASQATVILMPNQTVAYDIKAGSLKKGIIDDASSLRAWTNGELVFRNETLNEITQTLIRRYNVHIVIQDDHIAGAVLNARFDKKESLENVLGVLSAYVGSRYKHVGDTYFIR
jgi:ferric-dicitrate binding protein FerR (iron transport regulator)